MFTYTLINVDRSIVLKAARSKLAIVRPGFMMARVGPTRTGALLHYSTVYQGHRAPPQRLVGLEAKQTLTHVL